MDALSGLGALLQDAAQKLEQIKKELETTQNENIALKSENETLRSRLEQAETSGNELVRIKAELQEAKTYNRKLHHSRHKLEKHCRRQKAIIDEWASRHDQQSTSERATPSFETTKSPPSLLQAPVATPNDVRSTSEPVAPTVARLASNATRGYSLPVNHDRNVVVNEAERTAGQQTHDEDKGETTDDSEGAVPVLDEPVPIELTTPIMIPTIKEEQNSGTSSLVVVSDRPVRRGKGAKIGDIHIHEDHTASRSPRTATVVKHEDPDAASSPLQPSRNLNNIGATTDSLDLDEVGGTMYTPRKRRRLERAMSASRLLMPAGLNEDEFHGFDEEDADEDGPNDVPNEVAAAPVSQFVPLEEELQALENSGHRVPFGHLTEQDRRRQASPNADSDRVRAPLSPTTSPLHPCQSPMEECAVKPEPRQKDIYDIPSSSPRQQPSTRALGSDRRTYSKKRKRTALERDHGASAVPSVTEDGEFATPASSASTSRQSKRPSGTRGDGDLNLLRSKNVNERLDNLLQNSPPQASTVLGQALQSTRRTYKRPKDLAWMLGGSNSTSVTPSPTKGKPPGDADLPAMTPSRESIKSGKRDVPPTLANPVTSLPSKRVQGHPLHAFFPPKSSTPQPTRLSSGSTFVDHTRSAPPKTTTPRGAPQKVPSTNDSEPRIPLRNRPFASLTSSDFKLNPKYAHTYTETLRSHSEKKAAGNCKDPFCPKCIALTSFLSATLPPLSPSSRQKLLENYIGRPNRATLLSLGETEKEALVKKAQEEQWKDMFGKHKQRFDKPAEPVGYWDIGFPSSQDRERAREEQDRRDEEVRKMKYQEAIRGGDWVFADEVGKVGAKRA